MTGSGDSETKPPRPKIAAMERGTGGVAEKLCGLYASCCHTVYTGPGPARYSLPSLTGREGHSPTKTIHPSYSFGKKLGGGCKYYRLGSVR